MKKRWKLVASTRSSSELVQAFVTAANNDPKYYWTRLGAQLAIQDYSKIFLGVDWSIERS